MRLRLGRPSLTPYAGRFDVPAAVPGGLSVTFLGVSTLLLDDGASALMTDGFFSRPGLGRVALGTIAPDIDRIDACLHRAGVDRLEAVLPVHSHFDHVMDSAVVEQEGGDAEEGDRQTAGPGGRHVEPVAVRRERRAAEVEAHAAIRPDQRVSSDVIRSPATLAPLRGTAR